MILRGNYLVLLNHSESGDLTHELREEVLLNFVDVTVQVDDLDGILVTQGLLLKKNELPLLGLLEAHFVVVEGPVGMVFKLDFLHVFVRDFPIVVLVLGLVEPLLLGALVLVLILIPEFRHLLLAKELLISLVFVDLRHYSIVRLPLTPRLGSTAGVPPLLSSKGLNCSIGGLLVLISLH